MANWAGLGSPGTPPGGTSWLKRCVLPAGMLNISKQGQTEELCGDRTNHIQSHNVHIFKWTLQLLFRSNIQNPKLDFFFFFFSFKSCLCNFVEREISSYHVAAWLFASNTMPALSPKYVIAEIDSYQQFESPHSSTLHQPSCPQILKAPVKLMLFLNLCSY